MKKKVKKKMKKAKQVKKAKLSKKTKPSKKSKPVKKAPKKAAKKPVTKAVKKAVKSKAKPEIKEVVKPKKEQKFSNEQRAVFISLGSNVGDREEYIEQAIALFKETPGIKVIRRSSNFETQPVGRKNQPLFINSALEISTNIHPIKLLEITQSFEDVLGRERAVQWGPRTIDIDILLYGKEIISEDRLQIPHPLMHERLFVLEPLKEIAPQVLHPVLERTIKELYDDKKSEYSQVGGEAPDKFDDDSFGEREPRRGSSEDYERW